jgi:hypothetical protein
MEGLAFTAAEKTKPSATRRVLRVVAIMLSQESQEIKWFEE